MDYLITVIIVLLWVILWAACNPEEVRRLKEEEEQMRDINRLLGGWQEKRRKDRR
jgi:hypothetical protein